MTLLFDDAKKLEKAIGEEAAEVIAHVLERQDEEYRKSLATKADLFEMESRLDVKLEARINAAKADIIKWIAGLLIVQAASIAALVKLL